MKGKGKWYNIINAAVDCKQLTVVIVKCLHGMDDMLSKIILASRNFDAHWHKNIYFYLVVVYF